MADRRTVNPSEAPFVREAVARLLAGDSLRAIATDFNERQIKTPTGGQWVPGVIRRLAMSARISGQREHHGGIVGPARWDAIITPVETARVRALLGDPARRLNRTARRYLLAGLLRCDLCGATLIARPRGDGERRYVCARGPGKPGCGKIAILAEPLERLIQDAVLYRLDSPELAAALRGQAPATDDAARLGAELGADEAQLEELAGAYGNRQVTFREYLAARRPIEARIEAAKRILARQSQLTPVVDYVGDGATLRGRWASLPLSRQHAIVAALLDRAAVASAVRGRTAFDPSRVKPVWRV
jgi:hypothetical protein